MIGGATFLSILTDVDFFPGSDAHFKDVRQTCTLPMIRKDFIIEYFQVYESRALGVDCLLLIVCALTNNQLDKLVIFSVSVGHGCFNGGA